MNILIIGSGGREHALGWKLRQSPDCGDILFAPGNAGTATIGRNLPITITVVNRRAVEELLRAAKQAGVGLIVIGPEDPLAAGLTDALTAAGMKVFGPVKAAAQLEADKSWAKQVMRSAAVPTAESRTFTDPDAALRYVEAHETPLVVKAAGLAKGKGVIVCDDAADAAHAVRRVMIDREFGDSGSVAVIEERLSGQEVSILSLVDGRNILILEPSQDHKQVGEGDTGANTGGMGAYTPTPVIDDAAMREIESHVLVPTIDALRRDDIEYKGVLYAGIMLTPGGPKVLEFNCRFGDPECQPLMVRMQADLLHVMLACIDGKLDEVDVSWDPRVACCVVMCSGGYPGNYITGLAISGLDTAAAMEDVYIFHAGTSLDRDGRVVTAGGRVLSVVGVGDTLEAARERANAACDAIHFQGAFFRRDIGDRVLKALR